MVLILNPITNSYITELASKCLQTLIIMIVLWICYMLFVQPFLSPLRKVPGLPYNPLLGNVRFLLDGEATESHMKMVKEYGPIVRFYFIFGRERLLVVDPAAFRHVMVNNAKNYERPKNKLKLMYKLLRNGLLTSEGKTHARQKRLMGPAFKHSAIELMIQVFQEKAELLVDIWKSSLTKSSILPVQADLQRLTLDIIGCTAFGYDFQSLSNPDYNLGKVFHQLIAGVPISLFHFIPFVTSLPLKRFRKYAKNVEYVQNFVKEIIDKKRKLLDEDTPTRKDLLDMMMMSSSDVRSGDAMGDDELVDQVVTIMMAGHETTALALTWTLLLLARNPEIQEKLRKEILDKFPNDSVSTPCFSNDSPTNTRSGIPNETETSLNNKSEQFEHKNTKSGNGLKNNSLLLTTEILDSLEYLDCVIKESLRLNPPVPSILRVSKNNDTINSYVIPAGTVVNLAVGAMMRREDYFTDAEAFKPERFLQNSSTKENKVTLEAYLPFIIGPRMCLGHKFALIELKVALIYFLRHFKFELDPSFSDYKRKLGITMRPDPFVHLKTTTIQP